MPSTLVQSLTSDKARPDSGHALALVLVSRYLVVLVPGIEYRRSDLTARPAI